jgi:hypothetical protein
MSRQPEQKPDLLGVAAPATSCNKMMRLRNFEMTMGEENKNSYRLFTISRWHLSHISSLLQFAIDAD